MSQATQSECHSCGYEWEYTGEKGGDALINCPCCNARTYPGYRGRPGKDRSGGMDATCDSCGYEWKYNGSRERGERTSCPQCNNPVRL